MSIHNIDVDDTGSSFARGAHLLAQSREVSGKNRRRQLDGHFGKFYHAGAASGGGLPASRRACLQLYKVFYVERFVKVDAKIRAYFCPEMASA